MVLIARTDAESAKLLNSTVDVADHDFILGCVTTCVRFTITNIQLMFSLTSGHEKPLSQILAEAEAQGATGAQIDALEKEWTDDHKLCTFHEGELLT